MLSEILCSWLVGAIFAAGILVGLLLGLRRAAGNFQRGCEAVAAERVKWLAFTDAVEELAFEMAPPNAYTPSFVQLCVEARAEKPVAADVEGE